MVWYFTIHQDKSTCTAFLGEIYSNTALQLLLLQKWTTRSNITYILQGINHSGSVLGKALCNTSQQHSHARDISLPSHLGPSSPARQPGSFAFPSGDRVEVHSSTL